MASRGYRLSFRALPGVNLTEVDAAIIAVRLRGNKKVQNLSSMWYKKLPQQLATQGDFGLEPSYYTL
ncbi:MULTISPECIES: hypothetical protein, partial [unclassified Desulfovibrio]|uniref:hypothetical protein n=1 Tax=unclassified Desulfovibrio TaxID=2593640 RepID=UPI002FDB06E9